MDTYGHQCGSCVHLNIEKYSGSKHICYCTERGGYHKLNEPACYKYEYDDDRDYRYLNNRWYVVTVICKKLGLLPEEYECVDKLLSFREKALDNNPKYQEFLKKYDAVGPIIAKFLEEDEESFELCRSLCALYLKDFINLMTDGNVDLALEKYIEMLKQLENIYEFEVEKRNSSYYIKRLR